LVTVRSEAIPTLADAGDDVESELVAGQGPGPLGFGPRGPFEGRAAIVPAAANEKMESRHTLEGAEGAGVGGIGPQVPAAVATRRPVGNEVVVIVGSATFAVLAMSRPP
jgi:hypothetical protein